MSKVRIIYFCDISDDMQQECKSIQRYLKEIIGLDVPVELWERPPWEEKYDILFFDWGGMSLGNSLLEHFCGSILADAEKFPGRLFVMTSRFTAAAMQDASYEMKERPGNIYLSIEKAKTALLCFKESPHD